MKKIKKLLKNKFIIHSISAILTILLAFSCVWILSRGKEGYSVKEPFIYFCFFGIVLLFWLVYNKKFKIKIVLSLMLLFFISTFFIIDPPYKKQIKADAGVDPFSRGTRITVGKTAYIWQEEFWMSQEELNATFGNRMDEEMKKDRMLNNAGKDDVIGWSEEEVIFAFGEPQSKNKISEIEEVWYYSAWKEHPDWTMPVYMEDGKLKMIGDYEIVEKIEEVIIDEIIEEITPGHYSNETIGFSIDVPVDYEIGKLSIGDDPTVFPWYRRPDFLLTFLSFRDGELSNDVVFYLKVVSTTDTDIIMSTGGWEFIKKIDDITVGNYNVEVAGIDNGDTEMFIVKDSGKSYVFISSIGREKMKEIISKLAIE